MRSIAIEYFHFTNIFRLLTIAVRGVNDTVLAHFYKCFTTSHSVLFKLSLFTNDVWEKSTYHFSLMTSQFNMAEVRLRRLKTSEISVTLNVNNQIKVKLTALNVGSQSFGRLYNGATWPVFLSH